MSQKVTLELSDEMYERIQRQAESIGTSPSQWIVHALERQYEDLSISQTTESDLKATEQQAARERFERHFGEVDLGYATGVDNDDIDADLARAYADAHKAE